MPAVTTKFNDKDELDLDTFKVNIQAQLDAGVHGIILGGTLGEASTLTELEKRTLVRETVAFVKGAVPVIINIAEQSTKAAIENTESTNAPAAKTAKEVRAVMSTDPRLVSLVLARSRYLYFVFIHTFLGVLAGGD